MCILLKNTFVRMQNQHLSNKMCSVMLHRTSCICILFENEFLSTTAVLQGKHMDMVGCCRAFSGLSTCLCLIFCSFLGIHCTVMTPIFCSPPRVSLLSWFPFPCFRFSLFPSCNSPRFYGNTHIPVGAPLAVGLLTPNTRIYLK